MLSQNLIWINIWFICKFEHLKYWREFCAFAVKWLSVFFVHFLWAYKETGNCINTYTNYKIIYGSLNANINILLSILPLFSLYYLNCRYSIDIFYCIKVLRPHIQFQLLSTSLTSKFMRIFPIPLHIYFF